MLTSFQNLNLENFIINEGTALEAAINNMETPENSESMQIRLLTDKIIMNSNLKNVTDPLSFSTGDIPTDGGLFSTSIFGSTPDDRQRRFAYIDLVETFFHPYIFEVLCKIMPKRFEQCAAGRGSWTLDKDGYLLEVAKTDPKYNEDNTGIPWLIKNFKNMKFKESDSMIRSDRIKLLDDLNPDEIFITKWIVIPVFYRDLDKNTSARKLPAINDNYNTIIRYANSLRDSTFDFFNNQIRYNLQKELVNIRKYGQQLIEKKYGFFHKAILGKSIDRGSRDVISVPIMTGYQRPEDNPIDIFHTGIPLAKCLILGYDFVMRYCLQFFSDTFRNVTEYPVYDLIKDEYQIVGSIKIKDQLQKFTSKYIDKKINRFKNSHGTRFEVITIDAFDGTEIPLYMSGHLGPLKMSHPLKSSILNRPMTWTDLFYLAAVNTLSDKYVYITRYPVTSHSSIFPSICTPMSTIKTVPAYIEGTLYKNYPLIDLSIPQERISNLFNDTVTMSNMYLDAIGGDFDGDTVGIKLVFSIEANKEAKEISESIRNFVSPDGKLLRVLGKEAYLTFYNMTRPEPPGKILNQQEKKELLAIKKGDLTLDDISKLFGNTIGSKKENVFKISEPKFNPRSKFTLEPGEYINKESITTTVGIFLFNKLLVEGNLESIIPNGYYNEIINKKIFSKLTDIVAAALMAGKIKVIPNITEFLNHYEYWGLALVTIFAPSFSMELIVPNKQLSDKKKDLLSKAKNNNLATLTDIEEKLVADADKLTAGTPGKFLFDSGARGSFDNDFKNMAISIGPTENPITGEYDFIKSNYMEGISKDDLAAAANIVVSAEYPKAVGTAQGGYITKQFYAVFQSVVIDEDGTDCGTTHGLPMVITTDNLYKYVDQYLIDGKTLVLITPELDKKYMNKPVEIRSTMYCKAEKLCSVCAGKRFYKVGIDSIGLTTPSLSGSLQNASLKLRHNMKIHMDHIDENTLLL